jgi:hypothetical protein
VEIVPALADAVPRSNGCYRPSGTPLCDVCSGRRSVIALCDLISQPRTLHIMPRGRDSAIAVMLGCSFCDLVQRNTNTVDSRREWSTISDISLSPVLRQCADETSAITGIIVSASWEFLPGHPRPGALVRLDVVPLTDTASSPGLRPWSADRGVNLWQRWLAECQSSHAECACHERATDFAYKTCRRWQRA